MGARPLIHVPNIFPERHNGPLACDMQGDQFIINEDGEIEKVYFHVFSSSSRAIGKWEMKCGYFRYKEDRTLDESETYWMGINETYEALGLPYRVEDPSQAYMKKKENIAEKVIEIEEAKKAKAKKKGKKK